MLDSGWSARSYAVLRSLAGAWFAWFFLATGNAWLCAPAFLLVAGWKGRWVAAAALAAFLFATASYDFVWRVAFSWLLTSFVVAGHRLPGWAYQGNWTAVALFWTAPLSAGMSDLWTCAPIAVLAGCTWRPARPWTWTALVILAVVRAPDALSGAGAMLLHLAAWDPRWIPAVPAAGEETMYYDGGCGLCHRGVQFVAAELPPSSTLTFAPLFGERFGQGEWPEELPDTVILRDENENTHLRSTAAVEIARRMGGLWRVLAVVLAVIPRPLRDKAYDGVAATRQRFFAKPKEVCPMLPPEQRARFRE